MIAEFHLQILRIQGFVLPEIPNELWRRVLGHRTFVPETDHCLEWSGDRAIYTILAALIHENGCAANIAASRKVLAYLTTNRAFALLVINLGILPRTSLNRVHQTWYDSFESDPSSEVPKVLADTFESFCGALAECQGLLALRDFTQAVFVPLLEAACRDLTLAEAPSSSSHAEGSSSGAALPKAPNENSHPLLLPSSRDSGSLRGQSSLSKPCKVPQGPSLPAASLDTSLSGGAASSGSNASRIARSRKQQSTPALPMPEIKHDIKRRRLSKRRRLAADMPRQSATTSTSTVDAGNKENIGP